MPTQFDRPELVLDKVYSILDEHKGYIGLEQLQYVDDKFIVKYPCLVLAPDRTTTVDHGTHTYLRTYWILAYLLHAKMTISRAARSREDLLMVTKAIEKIEENRSLETGSNVIAITVRDESPDVVAFKKEPVVGTRMLIETEARVRWR